MCILEACTASCSVLKLLGYFIRTRFRRVFAAAAALRPDPGSVPQAIAEAHRFWCEQRPSVLCFVW